MARAALPGRGALRWRPPPALNPPGTSRPCGPLARSRIGDYCAAACWLARRSLGTDSKRDSWAARQLTECLHQLRAPEFAQHIHTDHQTVVQVAEAIASAAGLTITPSTDGPLRACLRRYATTIRHIRFD